MRPSSLNVAFLVLGVALGAAQGAFAQSDADVFAQIEAFRPIADAIVIDGDPADWAGLPSRSDAAEFPGDPARDVVDLSIAPQPDALHILAELAGAPLATAGHYGIFFDYAFNPFQEVLLVLDPSTGVHGVQVFNDAGGVIATTTISGIPLALGASHLEFSIPYAALSPLLPTDQADALDPANHRSFVRVSVLTFTGPTTQLDFAAPLASYRFLPTPYTLDPPLPTGLPNAAGPPIELELPFEGQWAVLQGAAGTFSHSSIWGWDWMRVDAEFQTSQPPQSATNEDYYAFGETLLAPAPGTVVVAQDSNPDNVPGTTSSGANNNEVRIDVAGPFAVRMVHHRQGSVVVNVSDSVTVGQPLAEIGNSGFSSQPHLHLDVRGGGTNRVAHTDVLVSLNPGPGDPWARRVASWEPRAGFLAEKAPVEVPMAGAAARIALVLGLLGVALRIRRIR